MEDFEEFDGCLVFEEIEKEEYRLFEETFAHDMCGWVAYEVRRALGDAVKHQEAFPGASLLLLKPKTERIPCSVSIYMHSENEVAVWYYKLGMEDKILSPEDAVKFILEI